ncbi:uncharacterized protein LOC127702710 [Mytilus californianus]|uniref:uncharacterized protein LOC127702710 n=1 Tax=Mytilus californianus TaxID=6549 RepID=UPI00224500C1|nr:uncharacterized protein LOC127702710 [Mytilus californianus]
MEECIDSQTTKDILICPICLDRFTKPKCLPCLHSFCEGCILTYSTSVLEKLDGKDHINCPVCRATVQLPKKECTPKEFVDQLPANFIINGILEKEKVTRPCIPCERLDIVSQAVFICIDCSDTLCDTCQKYHKANKASSNHDIKPISKLTDEERKPKAFKNICAQHSKKLKLFCNNHDVPCCTLCKPLSHRKCDNVVTIEEEANKFCTDVKLEKLKMDIRNVSDDFNTLLSHYTECLQNNETQYEDKQKMIEMSISTIISKVKALEITKKAELKKLYEEKKHILEDRMDTCTNCQKTVVSDKQTLEVNIEKTSEVQVMFEAQKIAGQIEKHKQLLKKYKFDGSKILIGGGTGIPILIDVFINSLFKISVSNEDTTLKLLTDETSPSFNSKQKSSLNQPVGFILNPNKDIKISGFKIGNTTSEQKSPGFSIQSRATPKSTADIKFGQTPKAADSTTPATGSGIKFDGQTVSAVKTTTAEAYTGKPPFIGGFKLGKLPESDKKKPTSGAVSFGPIVSSTSDKKTEPSKPDQSTPEFNKSTLSGFTIQQTAKLSDFSFGGETKPNTSKPASTFTFKSSAQITTAPLPLAVTETANKPVAFQASTFFGFSSSIIKPEPAKKDEKKEFGNQFNPKEGIWKCNGCLMCNNGDSLRCPVCGTLKPGVTKEGVKAADQPQKKDGKKGFGDLFKHKEGRWKCDGCLCSNNRDVLKCPACGIMKPCVKREDLPKESEKSSAFGSSTGGFNFGGKGRFTFGTAGKSDTKAGSGFTFPSPDVAKEKSESNLAFAGFTFTTTKSVAEKNKPDAAAKGFNFTLQPCFTPEKSSELQRPIFGTSSAAQNVGAVSSSNATPTTLPLLGSLQAASASPDKPLPNPVSMVTSIATGSSASKVTYSFGQQSFTTGTQSTSRFGQVSSTTQGANQNLCTSATKASTTSGAVGNICIFPQKENIIACKLSKETSLVNSLLKTSDDFVQQGYEPNVFIKPIIDLPDLIATKTGEEEGETVFCEKATLLRFDDGLWKERGSGELKLLRHKQTKRVQLLMRRDQVLKVYAKHFLTKKMKLYPLQSSKMAWSWIAEDLSEGEIKIQYFVVCFKDEDLALKFKATFEKLQSELQQVKSNQVQKEPAKTGTKDKPSLGSMLKKEEGVWTCTVCLVTRKSDVQKCATCKTMKPGLKQEDIKQKESKSGTPVSTGIRNFRKRPSDFPT